MTAEDIDTILALVIAEDLHARQHRERLIGLARLVARTAMTAEQRTSARLVMARLERTGGA